MYQEIAIMDAKKSSMVFLVAIAVGFSTNAYSQDDGIDQLVSEIEQVGGSVGFVLSNLSDQNIVISHDTNRYFPMASTQKLLTTAVFLDHFPTNYQYETPFYLDGEIENENFKGDLLIIGTGDPTIERFDLDSIAKILAKSFKSWKGNLIMETGRYDEQREAGTWPLEDPGNYYGGGASAFFVDDNRYYITLNTMVEGQKAEVLAVKPEFLNIAIQSEALVGPRGSGDQSFIYGWGETNQRVVRGSLPQGRTYTIKGYAPKPAEFFALSFLESCEAAGISVRDVTPVFSRNIKELKPGEPADMQIVSEDVLSIIEATNFRSNNVYAESLFKTLAYETRGFGSFDLAIDTLTNWLVDLTGSIPGGFKLYDGSGLSPNSVVTPAAFSRFLFSFAKKSWFDDYLSTIPVVGMSGTAKYIDVRVDPSIRIYAKTGSIKGVRTLAGYIEKGEQLFSFYIALSHYYVENPDRFEVAEKILEKLAKKIE
jgi:D-alanyl-D-alanine carboxypeptidase/D-alanyl-D-alanine-endopeptidase (penicillin-binding protein 4)